MLERLPEPIGMAAYRWIEERLQEPPIDQPHRVESCLPDVFECYVKVLNPFGLMTGMTLQESLASLTSSSPAQLEEWKWTSSKELQFGPISFGQVCQALDLSFFPEINFCTVKSRLENRFPVGLLFPAEDTMAFTVCQTLLSVLQPFTLGQVYFYFWLLAFDSQQDAFFTGELVDVLETYKQHQGLTPTAWWPEDRSWCLTTPYDLTFSLIGGSRVLIDQLLQHPALDVVEVELNTRVDDRAGLFPLDIAEEAPL